MHHQHPGVVLSIQELEGGASDDCVVVDMASGPTLADGVPAFKVKSLTSLYSTIYKAHLIKYPMV